MSRYVWQGRKADMLETHWHGGLIWPVIYFCWGFDKISYKATERRMVLFWFMVWGYSPSWVGSYWTGMAARPLNCIHQQEAWVNASTFFNILLLFSTGSKITERWCSHFRWNFLPKRKQSENFLRCVPKTFISFLNLDIDPLVWLLDGNPSRERMG